MLLAIQIGLSFLLSAVIVGVTIPIIALVSKEKKLWDSPNYRKVNKIPIPNLGGVAIFMGVMLSTLLCLHQLPFTALRYIIAATIIMFFTGLKDDILIIAPSTKFIVQTLCACLLIFLGDIRFTSFHGIFGIDHLNYIVSVLLSLFVIVGLMNAMNLIDGIDGLAGGLGVMMTAVFGIFFISFGRYEYAVLSFAIAGAFASFLRYNLFGKKNKVFMGDSGSLVLGTLVAILGIEFNEIALNTPLSATAPILSTAIVFVPFFDMIRVFFLRIKKRKSPFYPDMCHLHHRFLALETSHLKISLIILAINGGVVLLFFFLRMLNVHLLLALLLIMALLLPFSSLLMKIKRGQH